MSTQGLTARLVPPRQMPSPQNKACSHLPQEPKKSETKGSLSTEPPSGSTHISSLYLGDLVSCLSFSSTSGWNVHQGQRDIQGDSNQATVQRGKRTERRSQGSSQSALGSVFSGARLGEFKGGYIKRNNWI